MTNSESEPNRPIKLHASGEAGAIAYVSEEELEQLEDGEPFWTVVNEVPEFEPGTDWEWAVDSNPENNDSEPVEDSDNREGGTE